MIPIPIEHSLFLAIILFCLGLVGVLVRRNIIFILMSMEIMFNAVGLAFITGGARWAEPDGQIMFMLVLTLAAAEVSVALALVIQLYKRFKSVDIESVTEMQG